LIDCPEVVFKDHFIDRITKRNRFSKAALEKILLVEDLLDKNFSTKENVRRNGKKATAHSL
jgi:hypothetical protein